MKRANPDSNDFSDSKVSSPSYKERKISRPYNITVGSGNAKEDSAEPLLGSKTKGAIHLPNRRKEKQHYTNFEYGNYHSYYTVRRKQGDSKLDPRLDLLDGSLFNKKRILDIGCNSGNISIAIAKQYSPKYIKGVDIDESLIRKAQTNLKIAYSLNKPETLIGEYPIDVSLRYNYFPQSMTNMFGFMPMTLPTEHEDSSNAKFPHNVHFETANWIRTEFDRKERKYDTILALSITKWIQLHGGDEGLKDFFKKIYKSLLKGGALVLEPQEFASFQKRAKVVDPTMNTEDEFKFRPEDYTDFLIKELGFTEVRDLGVPKTDKKGFSRSILLYIK